MHVCICGKVHVAFFNNHLFWRGRARGAGPYGKQDRATLGARVKAMCPAKPPEPFGDTVPELPSNGSDQTFHDHPVCPAAFQSQQVDVVRDCFPQRPGTNDCQKVVRADDDLRQMWLNAHIVRDYGHVRCLAAALRSCCVLDKLLVVLSGGAHRTFVFTTGSATITIKEQHTCVCPGSKEADVGRAGHAGTRVSSKQGSPGQAFGCFKICVGYSCATRIKGLRRCDGLHRVGGQSNKRALSAARDTQSFPPSPRWRNHQQKRKGRDAFAKRSGSFIFPQRNPKRCRQR